MPEKVEYVENGNRFGNIKLNVENANISFGTQMTSRIVQVGFEDIDHRFLDAIVINLSCYLRGANAIEELKKIIDAWKNKVKAEVFLYKTQAIYSNMVIENLSYDEVANQQDFIQFSLTFKEIRENNDNKDYISADSLKNIRTYEKVGEFKYAREPQSDELTEEERKMINKYKKNNKKMIWFNVARSFIGGPMVFEGYEVSWNGFIERYKKII